MEIVIDLDELRALHNSLSAESELLTSGNGKLKSLLSEMERIWSGDTKFPRYKENIEAIIGGNTKLVGNLDKMADIIKKFADSMAVIQGEQ